MREMLRMSEKKSREWRIRLAEEIRHEKSYFVTLTIDDENLNALKEELGEKSVKGRRIKKSKKSKK